MAISLDDSIIGRQTGEKIVAAGKHALAVVSAEPHKSRDNPDNIGMVVAFRVLKDPENPTSIVGPTIKHYVTFPLTNADVEGHVPPDSAGRNTCQFLSALFDEVPAYPGWNKDNGCLMYNGEPIEQDDTASCKVDAYRKGRAKAAELWGENGENLKSLVGFVVYAEVKHDPQFGAKVNEWTLTSELPDDWTLSEEQFVIVEPPELTERDEDLAVPEKRTRRRKAS